MLYFIFSFSLSWHIPLNPLTRSSVHHYPALLFFCLISSCLTLLLFSPLLPFTYSLSTSSLTLLWPFTPSSSFHSFIPKLPPFFFFSQPSCHLLFFSCSSCSYPSLSHLPLLLFCCVSCFSWCLTKHGVCIGKMPPNMACRQRHHWVWSGISYQMSLSPRQPSLLSRENRSPLWWPVTQLHTQTHTCTHNPHRLSNCRFCCFNCFVWSADVSCFRQQKI